MRSFRLYWISGSTMILVLVSLASILQAEKGRKAPLFDVYESTVYTL